MKNKSELFSADIFWDCVCERRIYVEELNRDAYSAEIENYTCHSVTIKNIATNKTKTYLYDDYGKDWRVWASRPSTRELSTYQWRGKKIIEIHPQERCPNSKFKNLPTVFLTNRMIYFNHEAAVCMKSPQHIRVVVAQEDKEIFFLIEPQKTNKTYGIQRVKEAECAFRLEYYDLSIELLKAGLPLDSLVKHYRIKKVNEYTWKINWNEPLEEENQ